MAKKGISIIVCTFNGKKRLPNTLTSISQLNPGVERELILVDNASNDGTADFATHFLNTKCPDLNWKIINESVPGQSYARIAGLSAASFEYVLFCDDDNLLFPNYLEVGFQVLEQNPKIGVLGGFGIPVFEQEKPDWFDRYRHSYAVGVQSDQSGIIKSPLAYVYGAGAFFRKEPMLDILQSGFQLGLSGRTKKKLMSGDDVELCWLMRLKGYEIAYEGRLQFHHVLPKERLNEEYYIKHKQGTASGSGVLFAYKSFLENPDLSVFQFGVKYLRESGKSFLVYLKHSNLRLFGINVWEKELGFRILEARKNSFLDNRRRSIRLYKQLMRFFPYYRGV